MMVIERLDEQTRLLWGARVRPARLAAGLRQDELAEASGVSRRTIGNVESGRSVPQESVLRRLDAVLELAPAEDGDGYPLPVQNWIRTVVPLLLLLPEEVRDAVMQRCVYVAGRALADGAGSSSAEVADEVSRGELR